jgi:predicted secreted protein
VFFTSVIHFFNSNTSTIDEGLLTFKFQKIIELTLPPADLTIADRVFAEVRTLAAIHILYPLNKARGQAFARKTALLKSELYFNK